MSVEDSRLPAEQPQVLGFSVSQNQYQLLSSIEVQESEFSLEQTLEDLRKTRAQRLQASSGVERQEFLQRNDAVYYSPTVVENEPTFFNSLSVLPPDILESQSGGVVQNLLEPGAMSDDALYSIDVNDVACTNEPCNKRISYAGPEWSAGRPGHTPSRRRLACEKTIEDSCAGQDWSAGRPGNRPFGASSAACPSSITACLGPYGTASRQPHHTGPNTREETSALASSTTGLPLQQDSTMQALQEDQSLKIARRQRRWHCTCAGHPISLED